MRTLSMAAVLLILVGVIYVFSNSVKSNIVPSNEVAAIDASAQQMEDLAYSEKEVEPIRVLVQYQEKMPSRKSNPRPIINEGKGKKLVVLNGKRVNKLPRVEKKDSLRKDSVRL